MIVSPGHSLARQVVFIGGKEQDEGTDPNRPCTRWPHQSQRFPAIAMGIC
jgi:hypothetical protein